MVRYLFVVCLALTGVLTGIAGVPQHAQAEDVGKSSSPLQEIYNCAQISDDAMRLACYDAAAGRLKKAEKAGEIVAVHAEALRSIRKEAFGFHLPSLPKLRLPFLGNSKAHNALAHADLKEGRVIKQKQDGEIANVEFAVDHVQRKRSGSLWFYLSNGQIWEQVDNKHVFYPKHAKNLSVQIRKAAMGSYLMRINGKGRAIRVRRRE